MAATTTAPHLSDKVVRRFGPLGRLGLAVTRHPRLTTAVWLLVIFGLGVFAPRVEGALSGAGWQANGSQSVAVRQLAQAHFGGNASSAIEVVVHSGHGTVTSGQGARVIDRVESVLRSDHRVAEVVPPQPGATLSQDGRTAVVLGGARASTNDMVRAADSLKAPLEALSGHDVQVTPTGASQLWADFNTANLKAMLKSEMLSWPVTLAILVLAFGALVAAGLPLLLTMAGLAASAGSLVLVSKLVPVSIWAMNFAMMFALALGIDYALFLVVRFRAALRRRSSEPDRARASVAAVAETMATAGKAVAFSGLTVLVSLSTVLLVPSPAFRSMALGIMLSVVAVLAATLTLLPAVLAKLGTRIDAGRIRAPGARRRAAKRAADTGLQQRAGGKYTGIHRRPHHGLVGLERVLHHWGAALHRRPWVAGSLVLVLLGLLAWPVMSLRTGMPSIEIIPSSQTARAGYAEVVDAFGPGAPGTLSVLTPVNAQAQATTAMAGDPGIAAMLPGGTSHGWTLTLATPTTDPSAPATGSTIDRLRHELPAGSLVGGAAAENHDLEKALSARTPLVFGLLIGLGFLLLLVALGSPLVAFAGVITNLASIAAAFGVAKWIFQEGHLSGLLGFQPQGFVDAWAPLFFGAMLSGVAMDYTLFLLSAAREHYDQTGDPHHAMRMALRTSGRVVVAAAGVMVAVFLTFALSGPLAPKEMGIILAVAVFLDALCIRLIMLPVVLRVTGHAAWHRPRWLDKVLPRVQFSH